ncbi:Xaa-Pro aminopeptidase [Malassezia sp. CBS 17886]|nr:Xaa-Pro aminopeptidase [Malassezia sp. CBS 17886]
MLRRATSSAAKRQRPQIRHENSALGEGAGVTEGPIVVPGHNTFPAGGSAPPAVAPEGTSGEGGASVVHHGGAGAATTGGGAGVAGHAARVPLTVSADAASASSGHPPPGRVPPTRELPQTPRVSAGTDADAHGSWEFADGVRSAGVGEAAYFGASNGGAAAAAHPVSSPPSQPHSPARAAAPPHAVQFALHATPPGRPTRRSMEWGGEAGGEAQTAPMGGRQADARAEQPPAAGGYYAARIPAAGGSPRDESAPAAHPALTTVAGGRQRFHAHPAQAADTRASVVVGSLTQEQEPAALDSVISALTAAGRRQQTQRILRGAEGGRHGAGSGEGRREAPQTMHPRPGHPVDAYVDARDQAKFRDLNAVLRKLEYEWGFLLDDSFSPAALSLALLPGGTLRSELSEFTSLTSLIERSLQGTLDDHYDSFATAITVNHGVTSALGQSQEHIGAVREKLQGARDALGAKRQDLVQSWHRLQNVKEAMRVLALLEQLRSVPDELESLMSEKQFLRATQLLMRSLRLIQRDDLAEVGATADLRAYLRSQEHTLLEILIEELHHHLYLKSQYCDARWRPYRPGQEALPDVVSGAEYSAAPEVESSADAGPAKLARFLAHLRGRIAYAAPADQGADALLDDDARDGADAGAPPTASPEADSFLYMEMLLESLAQLGKIGYALEMVVQRLPFELHQLVDATIDEVDLRHDPHRHGGDAPRTDTRADSVFFASSSTLSRSFIESGGIRRSFSLMSGAQLAETRAAHFSATEFSALQRDMETMRDFFWTLFSKLDAVLQGHRVVQEVASMVFSRADLREGGTSAAGVTSLARGTNAADRADRAAADVGVASLGQVWNAMQSEVRSLLHDYLSEQTEAAASAKAVAPPLNDLLRTPRFERERAQPIFRMADAQPPRSAGAVRESEDTVTAALRMFVPGLVVPEAHATAYLQPGHMLHADETHLGAGHRLLVRPLPFIVAGLFGPALAFVARVQQVLPQDAAGEARGFGSFLDEFVQDRFLPVLEDKVQELVAKTTSATDAFSTQPLHRSPAQRPLVKSAAQMVALIDSLYGMLTTSPFHRESYARLILLALVEYYQRCNQRFRQLVCEDDDAHSPPTVLAAVWAQSPELHRCLHDALDADAASAHAAELRRTEARLERQAAEQLPQPLRRAQLLTSRRKHTALASLQYSVQWILAHLAQVSVSTNGGRTLPRESADLDLPLRADLAARYEEIPSMFRRLAEVILMTLRVELHLKTLYYLDLAVTEVSGTYLADAHSLEPDSHVVDLNAELSACQEIYKETLLPEHQSFLFDGLDVLMDAVLTAGVMRVRAVNRHGVTKMIRNILSLQQNLKNIVAAPGSISLEGSKHVWEMVSRAPEQWISTIGHVRLPLTFDEYKAVLDLCLGVAHSGAPDGGSTAPFALIPHAGTTSAHVSQQTYNEYLIELHAAVGSGA